MTATGRSTEATPAALESAGFVKLLVRPDGDALAAAGVLARAFDARGTPFQVSIGDRSERTARVATADDEVTIALGSLDHGAIGRDDTTERDDATTETDDAVEGDDTSADATTDDDPSGADDAAVFILDPAAGSLTGQVVDLVRDLDADPDPVLALAGVAAAKATTDDDADSPADDGSIAELHDIARETGVVERRPGVAIPTADPVDGLAHSTLVRADWSGDADAVADAIGDAEGRQLASIVAIDAVGHDDATECAAETIDRVLQPDATPEGPFATIGGTADVLAATARTAPVAGLALAMGHGGTDAALDDWRAHGEAVHAALDGAMTTRHDGVFVVHVAADAPTLARTDAIESVAELAAATMTPEPLVLAVGEGRIGVATAADDPIATICEELAAAHDLAADAGHRAGVLHGDEPIDVDAVVDTARAVA